MTVKELKTRHTRVVNCIAQGTRQARALNEDGLTETVKVLAHLRRPYSRPMPYGIAGGDGHSDAPPTFAAFKMEM
jgi:hypothetical protein